MTSLKPQTLKGFRDFLPQEKKKRDYVAGKIKKVFERFGFEPLETPTLEYAGLLLGKYGAEAHRLVYQFSDRGGRQVALKYDQTVPTARVLAQYEGKLPRYFRRYQIQNVFRAEKPQKGRFREFTQCDIDIFGAPAGLADAEVLACTWSAYRALGFKTVQLKINDRQVLFQALKPFSKQTGDGFNFGLVQSIDKLDKLGQDGVISELAQKGLSRKQAKQALLSIKAAVLPGDLKQIIDYATALGIPEEALVFTPTLARGLGYYTGMIFEAVSLDYPAGSLAGGGRYDSLVKQLAGMDIPAVGMAVGFDRTVEAAGLLGLLPDSTPTAQVLVPVFAANNQPALRAAAEMRKAGISAEVYPAEDPLPKQLKYADKLDIPWVIIVGEEETKQNKVTLKNMETGKQKLLGLKEAVLLMKNNHR